MMQAATTTTSQAWNEQTPVKTAIEAARLFQWSVIPLDIDKRPVKIGGFKKDGSPYRFAWTKCQTERAHEKQIALWQSKHTPSAWGIVTGTISNVVILDFDGDQGKVTLEKLSLSPHVRTGSGGYHVYFQHPGWPVQTLNSKSKKEMGQRWPGLDIRADGGYAAFCGENTSGKYEWLRDFQPEKLDILPGELRLFLGLMYSPDEVKEQQERATRLTRIEPDKLLKWALERLSNVGRNDGGFDLACQLRDNNFSESEATSIMLEYARRVSPMNTKGQFEPYTDEEAQASLKSAYSYAARQPWELTLPREPFHSSTPSSNGNGHNSNGSTPANNTPRSFNLTDLGNGERFAAKYKETVRWCETWNTWVVFISKCWEPDRTGRVDQLAKIVVRSIYHEAAAEEDDTKRKQIVKHAAASESNRAVRAMLDRAKSELPITPEEFNTQLHLLNCSNGTLDLRTGELRPHNPKDFLTRCIKVKYNPLATCERWETFISSILDGDRELITFMQQALGMSLSGDTSEQCLFICHGSGSNGKTTMLETVRIIMKSYGLAANIETFQVRKNEAVRNDIAELYGARLVTASENSLGSRLNEAFVKKATGKEPLRARRLHENEFEFMPEFTLWLAVNHKPVVKDTSNGMWRRVYFVPFNVTFEKDQIDKHLGEKLLEESEGILAWLVQGCIAWCRQGRLIPPKVVQEATEEYRSEMDTISRFLNDECILQPETKATTQLLLARYELWCQQNGERFNARDLKNALNERGLHSKRGTGGLWTYQGIGLLALDSDGSDGSDGEININPRPKNTSQKIQNLPSPTVTTVTNPPKDAKDWTSILADVELEEAQSDEYEEI